MPARRALVIASYVYSDGELSKLAAPARDAESFANVLEDPEIAGFEVTTLVNQPHHVVGRAIGEFYAGCGRQDLTLLYFSGHGLKDDEGQLHLAMADTRRNLLMFTAIPATQIDKAMDACASRHKVLILDCCYSGAFPAGRTAKSDDSVQTLERFQGKGRAVLTASDATQYSFEGDQLRGSGTSSVFTRHLVEAIRSGQADLDEDGDIALDELYSYVREKVVAEVPQQHPKKQEDVDGRIVIARNVHWKLPVDLRHAIDSPDPKLRFYAIERLRRSYELGNDIVRAAVAREAALLADDDSRKVSSAAREMLTHIRLSGGPDQFPTGVRIVLPAVPGPSVSMSGVGGDVGRGATHPVVESGSPRGPDVEPQQLPDGNHKPPHQSPPRVDQAPDPVPSPEPVSEPPRRDVLLPSLVVTAGAAILASRFLVFGYYENFTASDFHWPGPPVVVGIGLPLIVATSLLFVRPPRAGRDRPLAVGLLVGALLALIYYLVRSGADLRSPRYDVNPGPGWWLLLVGTFLTASAVVRVVARTSITSGAHANRGWRLLTLLVVLASLVVQMTALWHSASDLWTAIFWFSAPVMLTVVALPFALFRMSDAQRVIGLTALTVFVVWLTALLLAALMSQMWRQQNASRAAVQIGCYLLVLAACYAAQAPSKGGVGEPKPPSVRRR